MREPGWAAALVNLARNEEVRAASWSKEAQSSKWTIVFGQDKIPDFECWRGGQGWRLRLTILRGTMRSSSCVSLSSLEVSDTQVHEPCNEEMGAVRCQVIPFTLRESVVM